jgi:NAD+ synthetase
MSELNYEHVFNVLVDKTAEYVTSNNLKVMVLGISGGIDSTVVAAICHEVSKKTGIPLIGRSLPIKNKSDEFATSVHVGEAFCDKFEVYRLERSYRAALFDACADAGDVNMANSYHLDELEEMPSRTPIANGNLQARCRMMYLYDIASRHKGLVMSTDNQTEYQLGFWTIHGDVGDFDPIQDLWKTEVYGLANYMRDRYRSKALEALHNDYKETCDKYRAMSYAVYSSCKLIPTDGLGISNSDLEQIGAKDYDTVDDILSRFVPFENFRKSYDSAGQIMHPHDEMAESDCWSQLCARHGEDVVNKVWSRHLASEFKRKKAPIYISRELYE